MIDLLDSILLKGICLKDGGIQLSKPVCCWTPFGDVLGNMCMTLSHPSTGSGRTGGESPLTYGCVEEAEEIREDRI